MKKILSVCLVLVLVATSVGAEHVIGGKDNQEFLYVLSAKSGAFDGGTLTLKDIPLVIYFSDRPNRIAGHMSLEGFVRLWGKGVDSFKSDPPNATLSVYDEKGNKDVVLEIIGTPTIKNDSIICNVRLILGDLPEVFPASSLFVDVFTKNKVPTFD